MKHLGRALCNHTPKCCDDAKGSVAKYKTLLKPQYYPRNSHLFPQLAALPTLQAHVSGQRLEVRDRETRSCAYYNLLQFKEISLVYIMLYAEPHAYRQHVIG